MTTPICECQYTNCPHCGGKCNEPATRPIWGEWEYMMVYYCAACCMTSDREVIREKVEEPMKDNRAWYLAESGKVSMAVYATTMVEAERLAGSYPWAVGEQVVLRPATVEEIHNYKLRTYLL